MAAKDLGETRINEIGIFYRMFSIGNEFDLNLAV